ncbi:ribonuclease M5 [Tepidibacillus infernus]|uniref:Ribonuclease M5 n=1 Tax=Tepidibacillus decaturensis TaxID=1413211 RepID=A0A135L779_9BACI|nr:ribonuclease M5 [Tepidibacillus decaturensis]KXG44830.1 hypothetical protein U473_12985 [Tepidibacillus decaturensis]
MKIKEVIVVEGRDDTVAIQRAVQADTIETGGSAISPQIIDQIKKAHQKRGVIVLTDPDYPGERIRKIISRQVPGVKHAFIIREEATKKGDIGVENASPNVIRKALNDVKSEWIDAKETIPWNRLVAEGLVGNDLAKQKRIELGKVLGIGYANAKQLHKRLNMFQISEIEFSNALKMIKMKE